MSDSIPITIQVLRHTRFAHRFGNEIADVLLGPPTHSAARVSAYTGSRSEDQDERYLSQSSRGGGVVHALGTLVEASGYRHLAFLADLTHTHEVISEASHEIFRFTILEELEAVADSATGLLSWIRENQGVALGAFGELGCDPDGNYYESVEEVVDEVPASMVPNNEVSDIESSDLALGVSLLKTLVLLVNHALATGQCVVCEHWCGFDAGEMAKIRSKQADIVAARDLKTELILENERQRSRKRTDEKAWKRKLFLGASAILVVAAIAAAAM